MTFFDGGLGFNISGRSAELRLGLEAGGGSCMQ